ncbi:hypothetical protein Nisw_03090 [Candidatus Nitrosopumilus sp. SW]|uniref:hypothetical protein n=1 Tax=Candidatus Nitrosopumilus sp. SW TaxID=2508726 RepID=UPI00114F2244|nr:hypothetical protein [Candidatus Nitrosopumilus sp. SW]QDI88589.1 hypothetical protein Nisw_03090 [Candidatus Nitrosopumilus sp. SW]
MSFEKDVAALKEALDDTENRIKKLKEHKESEIKKSNYNSETLRRLEKNLENLHKKRDLILSELE